MVPPLTASPATTPDKPAQTPPPALPAARPATVSSIALLISAAAALAITIQVLKYANLVILAVRLVLEPTPA